MRRVIIDFGGVEEKAGMVMRCHAGACHSEPSDHGCWGWLCAECWAWCLRLLARLRGEA